MVRAPAMGARIVLREFCRTLMAYIQIDMRALQPKHSITGTSIFAVMSGLAQQYNAINLSQGFPDFEIDKQLADYLADAATMGFNQYSPMPGLPMLREAIVQDIRNRYGVAVDMDHELTVTPGATYGIYTAFSTVLQPGDEAIIFEPAYDSYLPSIEMNGAKAIPLPLTTPDFGIDWDMVKDAITPKTRAIILNSPHNPTGAILSKDDWDTLAALIRDTDIIVLSDEVYDQMVFDGAEHVSVLQHAELRERSFALYSFGKAHNNTGWKMGYVVAPAAFTQAFRRLHQFIIFSASMPTQYALAKHISSGKASPVCSIMQAKRDHFLGLMKDTPFTFHKPARGSYFQLATYEKISGLGDKDFAQWLTKEHGVATIPVSAFYHNGKDDGIVRFCFAKKDSTLEQAAERLRRL